MPKKKMVTPKEQLWNVQQSYYTIKRSLAILREKWKFPVFNNGKEEFTPPGPFFVVDLLTHSSFHLCLVISFYLFEGYIVSVCLSPIPIVGNDMVLSSRGDWNQRQTCSIVQEMTNENKLHSSFYISCSLYSQDTKISNVRCGKLSSKGLPKAKFGRTLCSQPRGSQLDTAWDPACPCHCPSLQWVWCCTWGHRGMSCIWPFRTSSTFHLHELKYPNCI